MGNERRGGFGRRAFAGWLVVVAALVAAQSIVHLLVVLHLHRVDTVIDLDRSNGLPDLVSTVALLLAALGGGAVALGERGVPRMAAALLASLLAALTLADAFHDGAHPSSTNGRYVIALVAGAAGLMALGARFAPRRTKVTLAVAVLALGASLLVTGLDNVDDRFGRARENPTTEYEIVAKEGLELLGWSLVALVLCDEALRRRRGVRAPATTRASRARAA